MKVNSTTMVFIKNIAYSSYIKTIGKIYLRMSYRLKNSSRPPKFYNFEYVLFDFTASNLMIKYRIDNLSYLWNN